MKPTALGAATAIRHVCDSRSAGAESPLMNRWGAFAQISHAAQPKENPVNYTDTTD